MLSEHPGDSQQVELLGRNRLIDELLRDNLEIALPIRDRGIDLIAYADSGEDVTVYSARPIQMKASWTRGFGLYRKYEKFPDLLIAYVWHLNDRDSQPNERDMPAGREVGLDDAAMKSSLRVTRCCLQQ